jgi:NADH-quinone oxidoreductase subunit H
MGDPLLSGGLDWGIVGIVVLKVVVAFVLLLLSVLFMVYWERKLIADMQNRIGPDRAGPAGILQTLADGTKFFFKEDLHPQRADWAVFVLAPFLSFVPAFLTFSIVPIGGDFSDGGDGTVSIFGHETYLQVADPPVGILLFLALSSIAVYGVMLAGWSSGSKYPLLGSVRASAQMVSYEAALGLSVCAVVLISGSLSTHDIVAAESGGFLDWNLVVTGVVPFVLFLVAGTAELNRPPFDLVEAEQELVGGFHTEYSSIRFALFFLAEFMNTVVMSAIIVTLFFGGPTSPLDGVLDGPWWGIGWFVAKVFFFLCIFIWFRATLPRLRYDQLMDLGWKLLIPLSLGWLLLLAAIKLGQELDWNMGYVIVGAIAAMGAATGLLVAAIRSARRGADDDVVVID